jgi:hypothetical protein
MNLRNLTLLALFGTIGILSTISSSPAIFAQVSNPTVNATETNATDKNTFTLLAKTWGGDFPQASTTAVYDSYSNQFVFVFGKDASIKKLSPEIIGKLSSAIEFSGIQTAKSDIGRCDFTQVCYLLQVTKPTGFTGAVETHTVIWNSDSAQTKYQNLNQIMQNINDLGFLEDFPTLR